MANYGDFSFREGGGGEKKVKRLKKGIKKVNNEEDDAMRWGILF